MVDESKTLICRTCFAGCHCSGHQSKQCECACKELSRTTAEVATRQQWQDMEPARKMIRARMKAVEQNLLNEAMAQSK
jgi:hypothetical protein